MNTGHGTRRGSSRGAAVIEYVLTLSVFFLSISVGMAGIEDGMDSNTVDTAIAISGDPYAPDSTTSTTAGVGPTTTLGSVGYNTKPVVDVPDLTVVPLDKLEATPFKIRTTITDDKTPLDLMFIQSWTEPIKSGSPNLNGDRYTFTRDTTNPKNWIESTYTAPRPTRVAITVCANDGLVETCDTGIVKVRSGTVHVDSSHAAYPYEWNAAAGRSEWRGWGKFRVFEGTPHQAPVGCCSYHLQTGAAAPYEFEPDYGPVTVNASVIAWYLNSAGDLAAKGVTGSCTRTNDWCYIHIKNVPGTAVAITTTITSVTGPCIDAWDGLNAQTTYWISGWGSPPTGPTTTSSTTSTSTTTSTTTAPSGTGSGTGGTSSTSSTTINDNT